MKFIIEETFDTSVLLNQSVEITLQEDEKSEEEQ